MLEYLNQFSGALALLALAFALCCVVLLAAVLSAHKRQDRANRELLRRLSESSRDSLSRQDYAQQSEMQSARLLQAMEERGRDEQQRFIHLSARLDQFGESQDARLRRVSPPWMKSFPRMKTAWKKCGIPWPRV